MRDGMELNGQVVSTDDAQVSWQRWIVLLLLLLLRRCGFPPVVIVRIHPIRSGSMVKNSTNQSTPDTNKQTNRHTHTQNGQAHLPIRPSVSTTRHQVGPLLGSRVPDSLTHASFGCILYITTVCKSLVVLSSPRSWNCVCSHHHS